MGGCVGEVECVDTLSVLDELLQLLKQRLVWLARVVQASAPPNPILLGYAQMQI